MIERRLHTQLTNCLNQFPAVALLGPRQVGKTTLALEMEAQYPSIYLDLESDADRAKLADPELYLTQHEDKLVILDEVQRLPNLFQALRGLIDQGKRRGRRANRFLLLGSASIDLLRQSGESLAGRIAYLELAPFDAFEFQNRDINQLWLKGGFPDSTMALTDSQSFQWRLNFIKTYLERDIPLLGPRIPAETLKRFWTMLAHNQGGLLNAAKLAGGLGVDGKTVANYLDLMVDLLLVRRLPPWHSNAGKRLIKSPKVYVRDSGLTHALLALRSQEELLGHPIVGSSWEGFVIENLLNVVGDNGQSSFYRSSAGAEIDLVIEDFKRQRWAIEVKRTLKPSPSKGFRIACEDIQADKKLLVYAGAEQYPLGDGFEAISLVDLINQFHPS